MSPIADPLAAPLPRSLVRPKPEGLTEYRHCPGRILFRGDLMPGTRIQIKCSDCGEMVYIIVPPRVTVEQ